MPILKTIPGASPEAVTADATHTRYIPGSRLVFGFAFASIGLILLGLFFLILKINHGAFTYTLDDPYIHLALSDQIRHGNYGINAGQHAAPSSSILFPFLLVPAAGTSLHPYLPLILNTLALFFTVEIIRRYFLHLELARDRAGIAILAGAIVLIAVCLNVIGIVFTGLEHSLHIATLAAVIYGLALFLDKRKMPAWLPVAIVLCPLFRYEGLPLSLAAILVLALRGRWRTAAVTFAVLGGLVAGFSSFLMKLGLAPLPDSVMVKSLVVANGVSGNGGGLLGSIIKNVVFMYGYNVGLLLLLAGIAAAVIFLLESPANKGEWTSRGLMSLVLLCMVAGHALAGRFGWVDRYEIYILVGATLIGIYLAKGQIRAALAKTGDRRLVLAMGAAACLVTVGARYEMTTLQVPLAANNIYEQQMQMHRFVNDFYQGPVAVNDLGLVSYHNPDFVLDLGGLASEKARILNAGKADSAAYNELVSSHGVHLAIVYDEWFQGRIPSGWEKIGSMDLSHARASASEKEVQFYATDPETARKVRIELLAFQKTLPPGVKLVIH
jgi:hypothetical protein